MSNPVFGRVDKEVRQYGSPVGFNQPGQPAQGQPAQYGQQQGYGTPYVPPADLEGMYNRPSATDMQTGRLTMNDVYAKSALLFGLMLVMAVVGWTVTEAVPALGMMMWMGGIAVTLVLGLVISFKKSISPALIVLYALAEGVFVGAVSNFYANAFASADGTGAGIVQQAVLATLCVFIAMFALWKFQVVRVTSRFMRVVALATMGYALFTLVNFVAAWIFGVGSGWGFGGSGALGIGISVFAVGLASLNLATDFESIFRAVNSGAPKKYSWLLAHGLLVTVVWLYLEILRLLARLRD